MDRSFSLLDKARQCRRLARQCTDARTVSILIETAESYERQARAAQPGTASAPNAIAAS